MKFIAFLFAVASASAQTFTQVTDNSFVSPVDGVAFTGKITVQPTAGCRLQNGGFAFSMQPRTFCIGVSGCSADRTTPAGVVSMRLVATTTGSATTPAGCFYRAQLVTAERFTDSETWTVPPAGPIKIADMRVDIPPNPSSRIPAAAIDASALADGCMTTTSGVIGSASCSGGGGGISSIVLTAPSIFTVGGSPLTSSGTLSLTLNTQTQNRVWAAPSSGSGLPSFRALVAEDIPSLSYEAPLNFHSPLARTGPEISCPSCITSTLDLTTVSHWKTALNSVGISKMMYIGDSNTIGFNVTPPSNGWASGYMDSLLATFAGKPVTPVWISFSALSTGTSPIPLTRTGSWGIPPNGSVITGGYNNTTGTASLTCTSCNTMELWYLAQDGFTGTFTTTLDGGSPVTRTPISAPTETNAFFTIALGSLGTHTVVVTNTSTTPWIQISGATVYNSAVTDAVRVWNFGVSGTKASDWTGSVSRLAIIDQLNPDLTVIAYGVNEEGDQQALATYFTALRTLAQHAKAGGGSCVIVSPTPSSNTGLTIPESDYGGVAGAAAAREGCAFVDTRGQIIAPFTSLNVAEAGGFNGGVHMTALGHALLEKYVANYVLVR